MPPESVASASRTSNASSISVRSLGRFLGDELLGRLLSRPRRERVEARRRVSCAIHGPERGVVAQRVETRVDAREHVLEDVLGVLVAQPEAA